MTRVVSGRARLRSATVLVASAALAAAGLLVPASANAVTPPQTQSGVLGGTSLADDGWTGPATDPANGYDFSTNNGTLTASNFGANGVITQLESPTTEAAGEPGYTDASFDSYHIAFTLDGNAAGGNAYAAQPGVSLEMDADGAGNRAGGGLYFTVPTDNTLQIDNFSTTDPFGQLWDGATTQLAFNAPVAIDYTVTFVAGGNDIVTVKANGTTVLSTGAGTYEGYSFASAASKYAANAAATDADADTVDQVLFRATHSAFNPAWTPANTDVNVAPYAALTAPVPTTPGGGFTFANLTYGAQNSGGPAFASSSTTVTSSNQIANYEDGTTYDNWHIGSNDDSTDPNQYFGVLSNGDVQLNDFDATDNHAVQLLKGIPAADAPHDLYALVAQGMAWTLPTSNLASFQIAVTDTSAIPGNHFATLHSESDTEHTGINLVRLNDPWVATKAVGDIPVNTVAPLGAFLAQLEPGVAVDPDSATSEPTDAITAAGLTVDGFGVATEANAGQTTTKVGPIYFGGVQYAFSAGSAITLPTPTIIGKPAVGNPLTVKDAVAPVDATLTYQWYRNGVAISGSAAKLASYTPVNADYYKKLSVKVTASLTGYTKKSATSAQTARVGMGSFSSTGDLTVTGTAQVGMKLSISKPTYSPAAAAYTYQWRRNGSKISGATHSTYVQTASDLGTNISVTVTATRGDYTSLSITSAAVGPVVPGVLGVSAVPTIKGTLQVGKTLTASSGGWTANGSATTGETKRYFWFVSDGSATPDISNLVQAGTSSTLTLAYWAKGLTVSVYVVGVENGYTSATSGFSAFTAVVH